MAEEDSRTDGSTRWIETSRGILSYSQIAPLIAERVLFLEAEIARGVFDQRPLNEAFLRFLHSEICGGLFPEWGGKWRSIPVTVGSHTPPAPHLIGQQMRAYALDIEVRLNFSKSENEYPELLAFAEGRVLSIHPFADFNGRVTRVWLSEILRRLQLPPVLLAPENQEKSHMYLKALRAGDQGVFEPLIQIWLDRLNSWGIAG
jgi:CRISPR-associated endonuclease/helicase Cas3